VLSLLTFVKRQYVAISLALTSVCLVVLANRRGVGWSYDSADYVAVGASLSRGLGALDVIGKPTTVHPPGFSALIALGMWSGMSSALSILIINSISTAVTVLCTFLILRSSTQKLATSVTGTMFVVFAPALMWQYSMAYSEPLFVSLEMVAIIVVLYMRSTWKYFILTLLASALFYVRYIGPIFTAMIVLVSLLSDIRVRGFLRALVYNSAVVVASSVPTWLLLAHNKRIDGKALGFMQGGGGSYWKAFTMLPGTLGEWISGSPPKIELLSWSVHPMLPKIATICLMVVVLPLTGLMVWRRYATNERFLPIQFATLTMMATLIVGYCVFSVYRFVKVHRASLDDRVMIPIYVPIVIVLVIVVENAVSNKKLLRVPIVALCGLLLLFQVGVTLKQSWVHGRNGRYLTSRQVYDWPLHKFVRSLPPGGRFFSNEMQTLFATTGSWPIGNPWMGGEESLVACTHRYVVWYNYSIVTDNKPDALSPTIYEDSIGSVFDVGPCGTDIDLFWN
jgi:hypothetical protein